MNRQQVYATFYERLHIADPRAAAEYEVRRKRIEMGCAMLRASHNPNDLHRMDVKYKPRRIRHAD